MPRAPSGAPRRACGYSSSCSIFTIARARASDGVEPCTLTASIPIREGSALRCTTYLVAVASSRQLKPTSAHRALNRGSLTAGSESTAGKPEQASVNEVNPQTKLPFSSVRNQRFVPRGSRRIEYPNASHAALRSARPVNPLSCISPSPYLVVGREHLQARLGWRAAFNYDVHLFRLCRASDPERYRLMRVLDHGPCTVPLCAPRDESVFGVLFHDLPS